MLDRFLRLVLHPQNALFKAWKFLPMGSFKRRMDWDIFSRPHYAYCTWHAARQASLLGIKKISLLEFGVAGGNGLVELERLAEQVEKEFDTRLEIYGFDTGEGLPSPIDYRDLPYVWKEGFFRMDVPALQSRLTRSKLVLGDVKDTVPRFFEDHAPAPVGAIFMDLDFYSSTRDGLQILDAAPEHILPRAFCYFDDILSVESGGILCDEVGQLLAIREYNAASASHCLAPISGLASGRRRPATWNQQIFVHHAFDHPEYNTYVHADADRQLQLRT